ncbi:hypothetical protein [Sphingomonas morindae]|uniref:Uncharacterized protein n=1 Tax=Sphingomonas morindae TaxID=1541170 RepID=A0ABY4X428_9SPHN|nr:hypothetical protein [Sphingomonas morindae]USI71629.1 hypothetical protein LHA26_09800 [Sphingomonas morindae]
MPAAARDLLPAALAEADEQLVPAPPELIVDALTPVLAMVAPTGLNEDDRVEWLAAAADALRGIPGDLLYRGIRVSRASVDHPAKIVPAIMAAVQKGWAQRRSDRSSLRWLAEFLAREKPEPVEVCTPEQAAEILREAGLSTNVEDAGTREPAGVDAYIAAGLSQAEAEQAVRDHKAQLARNTARPIVSSINSAIAA